jgi:two-component system, NarL family, sensor kinase
MWVSPSHRRCCTGRARELLTNIGKHAKATTVRVGLTRRGDRIILTITDDGTGFNSAIVAQYVADGHIGLGSLLARFDAMGGAMDINSRTGHGTQVTVTSPPEPGTSPRELGPHASRGT